MALGFYFAAKSFSPEQYDEAIRRLDAAGAGAPAGRSYHCAFAAGPGGLHIFDVWESQESFDRFGETLMPILTDIGVDPGDPMVAEVYSTAVG